MEFDGFYGLRHLFIKPSKYLSYIRKLRYLEGSYILPLCYILLAQLTNLQLQIEELREACELSDDIRILYGIGQNATNNDLYENIYKRFRMIMLDKALMTLTVQTTNGNPLKDVIINDLLDENNIPVKTNANGIATGFLAEGTTTLSITDYADIEDYSQTFQIIKGETYSQTWNVTTRNYLRITDSREYQFSENVSRLDVSAVGAGGRGGPGKANAVGGAGGGGGYVSAVENVSFLKNMKYLATIGAPPEYYQQGGYSSFLEITADGGNSASSNGAVGTGNGDGGIGGSYSNTNSTVTRKAKNGTAAVSDAWYTSFTDSVLAGGGGGGGGAGRTLASAVSGSDRGTPGMSGGSPNGGSGGSSDQGKGYPGIFPGGAGGGGAGIYDKDASYSYDGGVGAAGVVAIRMHLAVT